MIVLTIIILKLVLVNSRDDSLVRYYKNLIQKETFRAMTRTFPGDAMAHQPRSRTRTEFGTFDHIVVGAGASGAIVASRLSEDPERSVLILEAGGEETDFTDIPAMAEICERLEYNWNYVSVPQNNSCLSEDNGQCHFSRGKSIGGSTTVNGLFYGRGNERDYMNWESMGNPGWGYENVLPFFKKLENYKFEADSDNHGYDGYMNVEYTHPDNLKMNMFLDAISELGIPIGDYNGNSPVCAGKAQLNNIDGRRGSTGRAYLRPVYHRENLVVSPNSYVTKILVNPNTKRAYGVVFTKNGKYYVAKSRKEVVLSAGAFGSPHLLMLSGIGHRDHLRSLNISVIRDLPVGSFLQDHVSFAALYFQSNLMEPRDSLEMKVREYLQAKGVLTYGFALAAAFLQTKLSQTENYPDVELLVHKYQHALENGTPGLDRSRFFSIHILLLHPKSLGTVRLNSSNPFLYPLVDPNYYSDPNNEDMETMYAAIQLVLDLLETEAFRRHNVQLIRAQEPECEQYEYLSKDYWYCQIRQLSASYSHFSGTCRMGPDPSNSVVDHKLKVHGIKNLMVADASVIPDCISGHNSAPCMMIGERAADIIRSQK